MEQKNPRSRRILALLLCAAMLLTNIPLSVGAETIGKDLATASTTVTAADVQREAPRQFSWTVQNVNYYEKGDVIVLDEFWAATIKDSPSSFNEGSVQAGRLLSMENIRSIPHLSLSISAPVRRRATSTSWMQSSMAP